MSDIKNDPTSDTEVIFLTMKCEDIKDLKALAHLLGFPDHLCLARDVLQNFITKLKLEAKNRLAQRAHGSNH